MPLQRLSAAVPSHVRDVCMTLTAAGHQAVVVGGCVRDVIMGRVPVDWDVATSALPQDVLALFRRTRPQGLQHGTVVVEMGRHKDTHVEVTTFRGEGAYSDARRPDSVTFGVPLVDDLARRDLVVNAIAFDPAKQELIDPFGGQDDIARKRLRAVGNAVDRFTEDGLRVMRAVRFAAQLEFDLVPETEAGIPPALGSLAKVSRERVCDELRKLLAAPQPSRGLLPAHRTGIIASILPDLVIDDVGRWLSQIDRAARPVRLALLVLGLRGDPEATLRNLKFSNDETKLVVQLLRVAPLAHGTEWAAEGVRRVLSGVDKDKRPHVIELWDAIAPTSVELIQLARTILAENQPLAVGDLAISGKDLIMTLQLTPGPAIGRILAALLELVLVDPSRNTPERLLAEARSFRDM